MLKFIITLYNQPHKHVNVSGIHRKHAIKYLKVKAGNKIRLSQNNTNEEVEVSYL